MIKNSVVKTYYPLISYPKISFGVITVIGLISVLVNFKSSKFYFYTIETLYLLLSLSLQFIVIWIYKAHSTIYNSIREKLRPKGETIDEWFTTEKKAIFGNWQAYALGILTTTFVLSTYAYLNSTGYYMPWWGLDRHAFFLFSGLFFILLGIIAFIYIRLIIHLFKLSNLEIIEKPLSFFGKEAEAINRFYLKLFAIGIVLYLFAIFIISISPARHQFYVSVIPELFGKAKGDRLVLLLALFIYSIATSALAFLIIFQYAIHRIMKKFKLQNYEQLSIRLTSAYNEWDKKQTTSLSDRIDGIIKLLEYTKKQTEWAIDFKTFLVMTSPLIFPLLKDIIIRLF